MKKIHTTRFALIVLTGVTFTAVAAKATTIYYDSFDQAGTVSGTTPDVTINSNTWAGSSALSANGSALPSTGAAYSALYLPVNDTSGVTLDGSKDFTLSADVWATTGEIHLILCTNTSFGSGDSSANTANWYLENHGLQIRQRGTWKGSLSGSYVTSPSQTINLELSYSAATQQISFMLNGTPVTQSANPMNVTAVDIQALHSVGFNFYNADAGVDNFTLTVVPEPATMGLLAIGGLLIVARRHVCD